MKFIYQNTINMEIQYYEKLFNRNWFVYDDDINNMIHEMSEPAFQHVYNNRHKYPANVHHCIEPMDAVQPNSGKMKLSEMSESDMLLVKRESSELYVQEVDQKWAAFKLLHSLERPADSCDTDCDDAFAEFQRCKRELNAYTATRKVAYVAPSARKTPVVDTRFNELEAAVIQSEMDYNLSLEMVKFEDTKWNGQAKFNWFNEHML